MAFQSVTRATPLTAFRTATLPVDARHPAVSCRTDLSRAFAPDLTLSIHKNLAATESEWCRFEQVAECTPF